MHKSNLLDDHPVDVYDHNIRERIVHRALCILLGENVARSLGVWGEDQAVNFLRMSGYRIIERNYRVWEGEIDVIVERDGTIIFIEVKTRSSDRFGEPEESMTEKKKVRLLRAGFQYLEIKDLLDHAYRFDMIAIECSAGRVITRLEHYQDVISMNGWE